MRIAFLGLGHMGLPMATNLARSGADLVVWNRTHARTAPLARSGARVASTAAEAVAASDLVILMLANSDAIDEVLGRGTSAFGHVKGRIVVHMGTTSAPYSAGLGGDVEAAGGRYVEAPVSGSRVPAEQGQLVAMTAGPSDLLAEVAPVLAPMCTTVVAVGEVPAALDMKLAVNTFLITQVVGLVESVHLARQLRLDLALFQQVVDAGPMASAVSKVKLAKLLADDLEAQATVSDVLYNAELIEDAARRSECTLPLLEQAAALLREAEALGHGRDDMVAVGRALGAGVDAG